MGWKIASISLLMRQIQVVNLNVCHLKLNMLYSLKYKGWKYSLFRKSSQQDRRACHKPVSHRYHMSGRPLQTKLPKVYILWHIPKLLGLWKGLTRKITRLLHKKTVRWMSDNDISRIVERLRPSLPQICKIKVVVQCNKHNPHRRQQGIHYLPQLRLQLFYSYFVDQVSCKGTGPPLHIKELAIDGQLQLLPTTEQTTTWDQIEE